MPHRSGPHLARVRADSYLARMMPADVRLCGEPVPQPGHICAFFDSEAEKYSTLVPYFIEAIAAGDRVINVVERGVFDHHVDCLRERHVPVERATQSDSLRLGKVEDVYHRNGVLDLDAVLDMLRLALTDAAVEGRHVRTCGEMTWVTREEGVLPRVLEYEAMVNTIVTDSCTMMCVYDKATLPASTIADIIATHSYTVVNNRLRRNPNYVQPADYLAMLRSRRPSSEAGT